MNIKASYNYQLFDLKKSVLVYYFVIVCVYLLMTISMSLSLSMSEGGNVSGHFNGSDFSSMIFLFIIGLCSFKEVFGMLMQNGISRKSIFKGRLLTSLTLAFGMALVDKALLLIFKAAASPTNGRLTVGTLYEIFYQVTNKGMGDLKFHIDSFFFSFSLYLGFTALGYLITTLYYRMNKGGKIAVSVSVPVGLLIVLPVIDSYVTGGRISEFVGRFIDLTLGLSSKQPMYAVITGILAFILFSALSWLLIRKAAVKEQHE